MFFLQGLSILLWLFYIPILIGNYFTDKEADYLKRYAFGMISMFALFETITVPVIFLKISLKWLTFLWSISCLGIIAVGVMTKKITFFPGKWKFSLLQQLKQMRLSAYGAIGLILFQTVYVVTHMHIDDDDAWYVGTAVTAYFTNTIYQLNPYTGLEMALLPADYALSPYPVFWAVLGKLTFTHPAILMHTIAPAFLIPLSYLAYYFAATILFRKNKKDISLFMLFLSMFHLFASFSIRSVSTFMLFRIWQGKATLCSFIVPLTLYIFMICILQQRKKDWILLFMTVLSGTMVSSMGVLLMSVLIAALTAVFVVVRRNIKTGIKAIVCILPCLLQFAIYYFVLR